jgi:hypothetical protein
MVGKTDIKWEKRALAPAWLHGFFGEWPP